MKADKELCTQLNKEISSKGLAKFTWGNASILHDDCIIIKPSGVPFESLEPSLLSVIDLKTGKHLDGLKPSVDTDIHLSIYRHDSDARSVMHTHSKFATTFAQAKKPIPMLGTTHADYFPCSIPVTKQISLKNLDESMEFKMGQEVIRTSQKHYPSECHTKAVLMCSHGVMVWNNNPEKLVEAAIVLEEIAEMAYCALSINSNLAVNTNDRLMFDYHYNRKHGGSRYYGQ